MSVCLGELWGSSAKGSKLGQGDITKAFWSTRARWQCLFHCGLCNLCLFSFPTLRKRPIIKRWREKLKRRNRRSVAWCLTDSCWRPWLFSGLSCWCCHWLVILVVVFGLFVSCNRKWYPILFVGLCNNFTLSYSLLCHSARSFWASSMLTLLQSLSVHVLLLPCLLYWLTSESCPVCCHSCICLQKIYFHL